MSADLMPLTAEEIARSRVAALADEMQEIVTTGSFAGTATMMRCVHALRTAAESAAAKDAEIAALRRDFQAIRDFFDTNPNSLGAQLMAMRQRAERAEADAGRLRSALQAVNVTLTVPAAEYVPAIGDAFVLIDAAIAASQPPAEEGKP